MDTREKFDIIIAIILAPICLFIMFQVQIHNQDEERNKCIENGGMYYDGSRGMSGCIYGGKNG